MGRMAACARSDPPLSSACWNACLASVVLRLRVYSCCDHDRTCCGTLSAEECTLITAGSAALVPLYAWRIVLWPGQSLFARWGRQCYAYGATTMATSVSCDQISAPH